MSHNVRFQLSGLTGEQFIWLAMRAALRLRWTIKFSVGDKGFIAVPEDGEDGGTQVVFFVESSIANVSSISPNSKRGDKGRNKQNVDDFVEAFRNIDLLIPENEWDILPEMPEQYDLILLPKAKASGLLSDILSLFRPVEGYFITPILISINLGVFIMMVIAGAGIFDLSGKSLIAWGANYEPLTTNGEWWRLLTCCFLHGGFVHLMANMMALFFIGLVLEPQLGKLRFGLAYVVAGVAGSLLSLWWHEHAFSVGASGAIFGMYGVFLALIGTIQIDRRKRKIQLATMVVFVGYSLLSGLQGNTDNAAHIEGLVAGLIAGWTFISGMRKKAIQES